MSVDSSPRVFISYSQDSNLFSQKVLEFSNKLCADGIDAILDQYVENPDEGWPMWMEKHIREADYILIIASEGYLKKAEKNVRIGTGQGAKFECYLIYQWLYDNDMLNHKIIPVLFNESDKNFIPMPIRGSTHYHVGIADRYEALYWRLLGLKRIRKPPLGKPRPFSVKENLLDVEKLSVNNSSHNYNMALLYEEQKNYETAYVYYKLAIEQEIQEHGESSIDCLSMYNNYALLLLKMARANDAIDALNHLLSINIDNTKDALVTASAYHNLASAYYAQGDYAKALEWFEKALAIREKVLGKESPSNATTYNNIALVCDKQGDYAKALEWFEKALEIYEKLLGKQHPAIATIYNNIALVLSNRGNYAKALESCEKALVIYEKVLGKGDLSMAV